MDLNQVAIIGRIGKDPELRTTPSGDGVCSIGLANSSWKKEGNDWKQETSWFDVTFFGDTAKRVVEKGKKGLLIAVTGSLKQRTWEDQEGNKREKISIIGRQVQFIDKPKKTEQAQTDEAPKSEVPF